MLECRNELVSCMITKAIRCLHCCSHLALNTSIRKLRTELRHDASLSIEWDDLLALMRSDHDLWVILRGTWSLDLLRSMLPEAAFADDEETYQPPQYYVRL